MLHQGLFEELVSNTHTSQYFAAQSTGEIDRVFPSVLPQKVPRGQKYLPGLTYETRDVSRQTTYCGKSGLVRTTLELNIYSKEYDEAKTVAAAVRETLSDFRGLLGGIVDTRTATLENEFDIQDFEPGLYRVSQTWSFWHVE